MILFARNWVRTQLNLPETETFRSSLFCRLIELLLFVHVRAPGIKALSANVVGIAHATFGSSIFMAQLLDIILPFCSGVTKGNMAG